MNHTPHQDHSENSTASPYLAFYGLSREPFADDIEFDLYYPEPNRTQQIDILHHLTQYSDEVLVVIGPEGGGKSTLLQQFAAKASDTWQVARIDAKGGIDERNLMQQFYRQLELDARAATHPELLDQLQHHLDSLLHNARQGVLLIDNAHQLTVTALQRVLQLASLRNFTDKPLLRVILFAEASLDDKLADPLLAQLADIPRRRIDIRPFSEEHCVHYILHRLSEARFIANEPFSEGVLRKICKQSAGWPGRINALAHQRLLDSLPKTEQPPELPGISDKSLYKPQRLVGIAIVTTLLLTLILWDVLGDLFETHPTATGLEAEMSALVEHADTPPERTLQALALPTEPRKEVPATPPTVIKTPQITHDEPQPEQTPPAPARKLVPAHTPGKPTDAPAAPAPNTATSTASGPAARATTAPTVVAEKTSPSPAGKQSRPATDHDTPVDKQWKPLPDWLPERRHAWIRERNPQHYTLQVVAGEHLNTLQKFIRRHRLDEQIAFYRSTRKGQPWYALIYGEYPSKQAAIDARSRLPKKLRRLKPWIRDFASIQASLK